MSDPKKGRIVDVLLILTAWAGTVLASDKMLDRFFHFDGDSGFTSRSMPPSSVGITLSERGSTTARLILTVRQPVGSYAARLEPSGIPVRIIPEPASGRMHVVRALAANDTSTTQFFGWPSGDALVVTQQDGEFLPTDITDWVLAEEDQPPDSANLAGKRNIGRAIQVLLWAGFIIGTLIAGLRSLKRASPYRQFASREEVTPEALVDLMISSFGEGESSDETQKWLRLRVGGRPLEAIEADYKLDQKTITARTKRIRFQNTMLNFGDWMHHCTKEFAKVASLFPKRKAPDDAPPSPPLRP